MNLSYTCPPSARLQFGNQGHPEMTRISAHIHTVTAQAAVAEAERAGVAPATLVEEALKIQLAVNAALRQGKYPVISLIGAPDLSRLETIQAPQLDVFVRNGLGVHPGSQWVN